MPITEPMTLRQPADLLGLLRCPRCRGSVSQQGNGFVCSICQRSFPQERGIVRFVDARNYADSFGFQWQHYARTQLDNAESEESEKDFRRKTGLAPQDLKGKRVLDVGCGMG